MRLVLATSLCLLPAASFAANPDCAVFGEIVEKIVVERQEGARVNASMEAVAEDYTGADARFVPTIPYLAEWVYTLPEEDLTAEPAAAFIAQCNAQ